MNLDQILQQAIERHQAGNLRDAEILYRQVLAAQPDNPQALQLLGVLAGQVGRAEAGEEFIRRAIVINPSDPEAFYNLGTNLASRRRYDEAIVAFREATRLRPQFVEALENLGNVLRENGKLAEAIGIHRQAIALQPASGDAHNNLGVALLADGQVSPALTEFRTALALNPRNADAFNNLGNALKDVPDLTGAMAAYRQAIALRPTYAEAYSNLSNVLREANDLEHAEAAARQALALRPDYPEAHNNLGNVLRQQHRLEGAIAAFKRAVSIRDDFPEAHSNLANALGDMGRFAESLQSYRRALALRPDYANAYINLGMTLRTKGDLAKSVEAYERAIALRPGEPDAHFGRAWALLLSGDFERGWKEYEWRLRRPQGGSSRKWTQPQWDGSPLEGKTILLHVEQGFGDAIQFVRYVPLVAARGGRVILEAPTELLRLFKGVAGVNELIPLGGPLPAFDCQSPLLSLPLAFGTTLSTIPAQVPYVQPDPQLLEKWRKRLQTVGGRTNVGLAWAGRPTYGNDHNRSVPPARMGRLRAPDGMRFHSLAKDPPPDIAALQLVDHSTHLRDFADTAALIANLDLVISVDTAVIHLAGAMAKPVWVLLPFAPDWRWLMARDDSPWYPTVRLFRQASWGDWEGVLEKVNVALGIWYNSNPA